MWGGAFLDCMDVRCCSNGNCVRARVGASLLAMDANDNASILNTRNALRKGLSAVRPGPQSFLLLA